MNACNCCRIYSRDSRLSLRVAHSIIYCSHITTSSLHYTQIENPYRLQCLLLLVTQRVNMKVDESHDSGRKSSTGRYILVRFITG